MRLVGNGRKTLVTNTKLNPIKPHYIREEQNIDLEPMYEWQYLSAMLLQGGLILSLISD